MKSILVPISKGKREKIDLICKEYQIKPSLLVHRLITDAIIRAKTLDLEGKKQKPYNKKMEINLSDEEKKDLDTLCRKRHTFQSIWTSRRLAAALSSPHLLKSIERILK